MKLTTPLHSILIVDNDKDDQLFMRMGFDEARADVDLKFFDNGRELMNYLEGHHRNGFVFPKFILLDLNMPVLDGKDTLRMIKGDAELNKIPVVILSTSGHAYDIEKCYALGANGYVCKPSRYTDYVEIAVTLTKYWIDTVRIPENALIKFTRAV